MATYDNLPVYKVCYDLILLIFASGRHMQRDYRFTLGETMKKELVMLMANIYRANCRYRKKELISQARENLEIVRLLLRLSMELKQVPLKTFATANEKIENISRQLAAWEKSCKE
ncbi:four helix bundle protein [Dysgonomonas sp. 521]|uniref:four helix bundle protein n=1 Tax=Dysgonomonas sp. 521 TaxID=2302932 RepID=UPI0013D65772|nr:four helix bundle protein [Dysgonomonas sp. 521]NDV93400.1 four helix bundle protein [Dysgonomonas sp. 521]